MLLVDDSMDQLMALSELLQHDGLTIHVATSGADVHEGIASLVAWGRVAKALTDASGTVPVILTVFGPCVGGPALLLGLADHVVMTAEAYAYGILTG